jgi:16S rRNA processing protein RimM
MSNRIVVGQILGAHGVHGRVKVKSFTAEPEALFTYGPLGDEAGQRAFVLRRTGTGKDHFLAEIEGLKGKESADALRGTLLTLDRAALPDAGDEDEFYHADLIGLPALLADGSPFGTVLAIHDFGAGDLLEIAHASGKVVHLPFSRAVVPVVDVRNGRLTVNPPDNLFASAGPPPSDEELEGEIEVELGDDDEADGTESGEILTP